jgi:hypothetical protein
MSEVRRRLVWKFLIALRVCEHRLAIICCYRVSEQEDLYLLVTLNQCFQTLFGDLPPPFWVDLSWEGHQTRVDFSWTRFISSFQRAYDSLNHFVNTESVERIAPTQGVQAGQSQPQPEIT